MDVQQQIVEKFWKQVESGGTVPRRKSTITSPVSPQESANPASDIKKKKQSKEKRNVLEEKWQMSLEDDSWYRAPQFHPEGNQARRSDVEVLCEIIYGHGERYEDGTAAIGFTWLFKMVNRANTVGILLKAKKHGLVYFDGEIVFASVRSEDDDEFVVLQKPIDVIRQAFAEMRARHPEMFEYERKRRTTLIPPHGFNEEEEEEEEDELSESD